MDADIKNAYIVRIHLNSDNILAIVSIIILAIIQNMFPMVFHKLLIFQIPPP